MPRIDPDFVYVFVFRRAGGEPEFLMLRRAAGQYLGNTWHPAGGTIQRGEKAWQAALRELHEEARLEPLRLWQADTVHAFYVARYDRILLATTFVAEVDRTARVVLSEEHSAFRWDTPRDVAAALLWPGQRSLLREIMDEILTGGPAEPYLRIRLD